MLPEVFFWRQPRITRLLSPIVRRTPYCGVPWSVVLQRGEWLSWNAARTIWLIYAVLISEEYNRSLIYIRKEEAGDVRGIDCVVGGGRAAAAPMRSLALEFLGARCDIAPPIGRSLLFVRAAARRSAWLGYEVQVRGAAPGARWVSLRPANFPPPRAAHVRALPRSPPTPFFQACADPQNEY